MSDPTNETMTLSVSDDKHLSAWADTGEGYRIEARQFVLTCLWCDYVAIGHTRSETVNLYRTEHENPIVHRAEIEHRAQENALYSPQEASPAQ